MNITKQTGVPLLGLLLAPFGTMAAEQWEVFETSFTSAKEYDNPFTDVEVDVVFQNGDQKWVVPAFWAGGDRWTVRFAPPVQGGFQYEVKCSDASNKDLNGETQSLEVTAYTGDNPLHKHGRIGISGNVRHFQHADGTPFFWLGDTWWKCLAKRLTWEGFQELAADRKQKGFSVIQIVAGPYPDEGPFEPIAYSAYYFDPATGRRFDAGTVEARACTGDSLVASIDGHTEPRPFASDSGTTFKPKQAKEPGKAESAGFAMPDLPSPQDWVLVLERIPQQ